MSYRYLVMLGLSACCGLAQAQERTAGSALDTQMTWSALSNQINSVSTAVNALDTKVMQTTICGKKGMLYSPGAPGADAQGCLEASKAGDTTTNITKLADTIKQTNTSLSSTSSLVTNILNCNKSGLVFNGASCITPASNAPKANCSIQTTMGSGDRDGVSTSCPGGYNYTGSTGGSGYGRPVCARVVCS